MASEKTRVICVGEVMVELARGADNRYGLSFGGDTFNTAVYLARAGIPAGYASAMGDDPYALMAGAARRMPKPFRLRLWLSSTGHWKMRRNSQIIGLPAGA